MTERVLNASDTEGVESLRAPRRGSFPPDKNSDRSYPTRCVTERSNRAPPRSNQFQCQRLHIEPMLRYSLPMTVTFQSVSSAPVGAQTRPCRRSTWRPSSLRRFRIQTSIRTLVILSLIAVPGTGRLASQTQTEMGSQGPQRIPEYVAVRCGRCHAVPEPSMLSKDQWSMVITEFMKSVMKRKADLEYSEQELRNVLGLLSQQQPAAIAQATTRSSDLEDSLQTREHR